MLDNTAFDVAGYDALDEGLAPGRGNDVAALAGCVACQQAIGDCAFHYARTGALSPSLAVSICGSMQRLAQIAWKARAANSAKYLAYVWLGAPRAAASREAEAERLAERIR